MLSSRRQMLKSIGVASVAASVPVTGVAATGDCTETVEQFGFTEARDAVTGQPSPVAVLPVAYWTESFTIDERTFEATEYEENRAVATITWQTVAGQQPTNQGPVGMEFSLDRYVLGNWETQAYGVKGAGVPETTIEIEAVDGEQYSGNTVAGYVGPDRGDANGNPVVIDGGETYRFSLRPIFGVALWEIDAEFQAFDPGCHREEGDEQA